MFDMTTQLRKNQAGQSSKNGGEFAAKSHAEATATLVSDDIKPVSYVFGHTEVEFAHADEFGDSGSSDELGVPLLRVTVLRTHGTNDWVAVDGASWCTQLPGDTDPDLLLGIARKTAKLLDSIDVPAEFEAAACRTTEEMEGLNTGNARDFEPANSVFEFAFEDESHDDDSAHLDTETIYRTLEGKAYFTPDGVGRIFFDSPEDAAIETGCDRVVLISDKVYDRF